jgi:probable rRNA maturation factor
MKSKNAPRISVRSLQRRISVDLPDLEEFAPKATALCLQISSKTKTALGRLPEVSVLIVSDAKIAKLHQQFMNERGPTDVITFQHGEIFISAEMAQRNARRFKTSFKRELRLYVVHGLLHLCGFDDRTPAGARKMDLLQRKILEKANL